MALDRYGNYSRSVRVGNRVMRAYLGKGPAGQLAALLAEERRSGLRARALEWRAEEARREAAAAGQRALDELGELLARAALMAAGYHQHDRGAWRRRRMNGSGARDGTRVNTGATRSDGAAEVPGGGPARRGGPMPVGGKESGDRPITEGELRELTGRAQRGDRAVLPDLMRLLDARSALWRHCGDVARESEALWIDLIAGRDLLVRQSLKRKVAEMKAELAGPAAPPMERLLVDRVVATWMQLAQADMALARLKGGEASIAQLDLMQRRQERAQRSHLAAIRALATVRRLIPPPARGAVADAEAARPGRDQAPRAAGSARKGRADREKAADRPAKARRGRQPGVAEPAGLGRAASLPGPIRDRMRGLVPVEEEN